MIVRSRFFALVYAVLVAASCDGTLDAGRSSPLDSGDGAGSCGVPSSFKWSSTGPLVSPTSGLSGIKDPTAVFFDNLWHVYATSTDAGGAYDIVHLSFSDWSQAGAAPQISMAQTPLGAGKAAPQLFYFAPQSKWYLVFEWPDVYSTSSDPGDTASWTKPATFFAAEPAILTQNKGSGGWLDFWVICDDTRCFLFFSDLNGHLYRSQTPIDSFPNGFDEPVIVLSDPTPTRVFEASSVYSMKGTGTYLLVVEAFDSSSAGRRYMRSWTAPALDGTWTPLQAEYATPFASATNVTFGDAAWTQEISHGEILRSGYDQKMEIDTCNLGFVYQGKDPSATGSDGTLPWRLGLLTATD